MTSNLIITARRTLDTISHLEALSKQRHLTDAETDQLERAIYRLERNTRSKTIIRQWSPQDDETLIRCLRSYTRASAVAAILKRSRKAVYVRVHKLRAEGRITISDFRAFANRRPSNSTPELERVEG